MTEKFDKQQESLEENGPSVGLADFPDVDGILAVQDANLKPLLKERGVSDENLSERGFLVHQITAEDLTKIISDKENHLLMVAKNNRKVEGYILGYDLDEWEKENPEWEGLLDLEKPLPKDGKIMYVRHVAVVPGTKGVGTKLEDNFFQQAMDKEYRYAVGEILREPILNNKSMSFHAVRKFRVIGKNSEGGIVWNVVLKDLLEK